MRFQGGRAKWFMSIAIIAGIFLLGMGAERIITRAERSALSDSVIMPQAMAEGQAANDDIPTVVERAVPAIVNIASKKVMQVRQQVPPFFQDPFFRQFFGNIPREKVERFLGSGAIVTEDGYILTNNHLVGGADEVTVTLLDKREFTAKVVGTDRRTDVAVLKIDAKSLPTIHLGKSSELRLGQTVLAIGYPFGVGQTVTMGIISALAKPIAVEVDVDFIQTDAAINPGNSGGALINTSGELVGINTLIVSNTGSYAGLGFAIPIDQARSIMDDIIDHGKVVRGYLGISMDDLTTEKAEFFGLKKGEGVIITEVAKGSPATKAGLKANDIIVAVNGTAVKNMTELRRLVAAMRPGDPAELECIRDGKSMKFAARVTARPDETAREEETPDEKAKPELALLNGVGLEDLNEQYRSELEIPADVAGVIVTEIDPNSPAADEGLGRGDVIVQVNLKPTRNIREFNARIKDVTEDKVMLTVYRGGALLNIVLKP
jgi:serine protease Do